MAGQKIEQVKTPEVFDVFFSHTPNSNFVFPNGQLAAFVGGRYVTNEPAKAAYLQYEIDQGHPTIYRKPDCMQLEKSDLAPDAEYRKQVIAQYLAEQAAAKANPKDRGNYEQGRLNVSDTGFISEGAAESSSGAVVGNGAAAATQAAVATGISGIKIGK